MEKFNAFVIVLLSCLSCFGQNVVYTLEEDILLARNSAILFEALSNLGYNDMMECLAIPVCSSSKNILSLPSDRYGVKIIMTWQVDSGFKLTRINFSGFNKVDAKYKQQQWYKELGLNSLKKSFKGDEITRYPILKAWCNEIIRLTKAQAIYCLALLEVEPYDKTRLDKKGGVMLYGTNPDKKIYSRTDTTDLEQWIKRMKQLKPRDAFLEYEKRHPKSIGPVNKVPSPPGCIIN